MLSNSVKRYCSVVWQLILTDLMVFRSSVIGGMIDTSITMFLLVGTMTYVMPLLGMTQEYGPFAAWGAIPSACIFELYGLAILLVTDIRGERAISSRLILPVPTNLVFVAKACAYAIKSLANTLTAGTVGALLLAVGGRFSLAHFSLFKLSLGIVVCVVFVGFFSLFMTSLVESIYRLSSVWTRILYPLWYLGGAQFSWQVTVAFWPTLGFCCLLNPITYLMEGVHAATLDPSRYLNFWFCMVMILLFTSAFGVIGIKRLKKQLQWV